MRARWRESVLDRARALETADGRTARTFARVRARARARASRDGASRRAFGRWATAAVHAWST